MKQCWYDGMRRVVLVVLTMLNGASKVDWSNVEMTVIGCLVERADGALSGVCLYRTKTGCLVGR